MERGVPARPRNFDPVQPGAALCPEAMRSLHSPTLSLRPTFPIPSRSAAEVRGFRGHAMHPAQAFALFELGTKQLGPGSSSSRTGRFDREAVDLANGGSAAHRPVAANAAPCRGSGMDSGERRQLWKNQIPGPLGSRRFPASGRSLPAFPLLSKFSEPDAGRFGLVSVATLRPGFFACRS